MSEAEPVTDPAYLEVPCTSCIASVDKLGWADELVPVSAGGHVLGIRTNTAAVGELVSELFADRLVAGASPERNYSLWLAQRADHGVRDLHRLYRTFVRTMRTRSARRALDTLWHELDVRDARAAGTAPLFDITVFVHDGRAHVLPGMVRRAIVEDLRRWERDGFRLVERGWASVDLDEGAVVIPPPRFSLSNEELLGRLVGLDVDDRDEGPCAAGYYPIATWTTDGSQQGTAARVGQAAMQLVDRDQHLRPGLLAALSTLLCSVGDLRAPWEDAEGLRCALTAVVER